MTREKRIGRSTSHIVRAAGTTEPPTTATSSGQESTPKCPSTRSSSAQCHRYHANDSRPISRIGGVANSRPAPQRGPGPPSAATAVPAAMIAAVPRVGHSAAVPGNGVVFVNVTVA